MQKLTPELSTEQKEAKAAVEVLEKQLGRVINDRCELLAQEDALRRAIAIIRQRNGV